MADAPIGVVIEPVLKMVVSLITDEIILAGGVDEQLQELAKKLQMIQALLSGAQSKKITDPAVQQWLEKLQSIALDAQIVLEEFNYEVLRQKIKGRKRDKVRAIFSSSNPLLFRSKMAHKIKDVLLSLEKAYTEASQIGLQPLKDINSLPDLIEMRSSTRSTDPYVEDSKIVGRENDVSKVISMLTDSEYYKEDLPVITILGMGGQGKTTLAQLVCKSDKAKSYFEKIIWVCVSDDFNVKRLLGEMQSPTATNYQSVTTEDLVNKLKGQLSGKKYLLVLDDVWNNNGGEWERMKNYLLQIEGSKESKILATARDVNVASVMQTSGYHWLGRLLEDQSWSLFERCAFAKGGATRTSQLVDIGKRILKRCGGVPLAIKAIGGLLYSKNSESEWLMIDRSSEMWSVFDEGNRVLAAIKLSYDHLPSLSLKQCFAYCAIFEKDTFLNKDQLIQLWMAQGLLNPSEESQLQMEDMGNIYFNILLRSSLLQDAKEHPNNYVTCKMHDLVHDVSLQVSKNYCLHIKDSKVRSNQIEAVHISLSLSEVGMWKSLKGVLPSKLRTLYLKRGKGGDYLSEDIFEDLFASFQCLSVLIVEGWGAGTLPNSIGKMKHLKLLDISKCDSIRTLPQSFTKLYYLQTLRVPYLVKALKGDEDFINLRHIHSIPRLTNKYIYRGNDHVRCYHNIFFPRLGQLTNLQMYQIDDVSLEDPIRHLNILCLQNVGSKEFATKFNLSKKSKIEGLKLHWDDKRKEDCDDTDVMEGLEPHSNLQHLTIRGYRSLRFPSWMVAENLRCLVKLTLRNLDKCETLPSLGNLHFLESLKIVSLPNVKCIGKEFYGLSNLDWATKSSSGSNASEVITLFPALRELKLRKMRSLVEWSDAIGIIPTTHSSSSSSSYVQAIVFPCLKFMTIDTVPNLSTLPNLGSLPSLWHLEVNDCKNLTISFGNWNRGLVSSRELGMDEEEGHSSSVVVDYSDIQRYFQSLRYVSFQDCDKLVGPFCSLISSSAAPLGFLDIRGNPISWPKDLHHLSRLTQLGQDARDTASSLSPGHKLEQLDCLPWPYPSISNDDATTHNTVSLTSLTLRSRCGLPKVTSLPHQIQYVTALTTLTIDGFNGLKALPEWLGNLERLQCLTIWNCKKLKELPSAEAFQHLINLQELAIWDCPFLQKRYRRGSGKEWPKIAHIPNVRFV